MSLPSAVVSTTWHQRFIAIWQAFPIWTVIIHSSIRFIVNQFSRHDSFAKPSAESYLSAAKSIYRFVFSISTITHIAALAMTLLSPKTLSGNYSPTLTHFLHSNFTNVFIPYWPTFNHQVPDLATGSLIFLHWDMYLGSTAVLLWAALLFHDAAATGLLGNKPGDADVWGKLAWKVPFYTLLSGPVGCAAVLLGERDAIVRHKVKRGI